MLGAALGALGGVAAASALGWASMDARSQLFGRTFIGRDDVAGRKFIALTYDDGPNDRCTLPLLDVLAKHGARVTFFMIGSYVAARPEIARRVAEAGHEIGNHTFRHPNLIGCSPARVRSELEQCRAALRDAVGEHSRWFRPPFGGRRPDVLAVVRALGMEPVLWRVSSRDWVLDARAIEEKVSRGLRGGDVILMHDGSHRGMEWDRGNTVKATDALIPRLRDGGYEFVSGGEMKATSTTETQRHR